jgi:hypothetical protein
MTRGRAIALAAAITLSIAVPTLTIEEFWHGRPMIDQSALWAVPAILASAAFIVGGAFAGWWARDHTGAGLSSGAIAAGFLVVADVTRRLLITHQGLVWPVDRLWIIAGCGAVVLSTLGGLLTTGHRPTGHRPTGHRTPV